MSKLFRSKAFLVGFFSGVILFICLNYYTVMQAYDYLCFDCMMLFGFPFTSVEHGGFVTHTNICWFGLFADFLITIICSFILGLILKFVWSKIAARKNTFT